MMIGANKQALRNELDRKKAEKDAAEKALAAGDVQALAEQAPKLPIDVNKHLDELIDAAWIAELMHPPGPDSIYVRDGRLARLVRRRSGTQIVDVSQHALRNRLVQVASWVRWTARTGEGPAKPPDDILGMMLAAPHPCLPELEAVVHTPVFGAAGDLIACAGYHGSDLVWYAASGLALGGDVPLVPTPDDLAKAVALIGEMIHDFPFASESDRTNFCALLLQPFVWRMIDGNLPPYLIDASAPGAGKTKLAGLVGIVTTGNTTSATPWSREETENSKIITAKLRAGAPVVLFDNVRHGLDSETLAALATSRLFSPRILGVSEAPDQPNNAAWIFTVNNPAVTTEIARRFVRVRLVPEMERPQDRTGFLHANLEVWTRRNRAALVRAVLILVRAWQAVGSPSGQVPFGSFDEWARIVGGIVQHAGLPDLLQSSRDLYLMADAEGAEWRAFVAAWHAKHKNEALKVSELLPLADDLLGCIMAPPSPGAARPALGVDIVRAHRTKLSKALMKMRDRVFEVGDGESVKIHIAWDKKEKAYNYRLVAPTHRAPGDGRVIGG